MILKSGDQINDFHFNTLKGLLELLDESLKPTLRQIDDMLKEGRDPGCLCDEAEYLIGVGFCSMQQYMMSVLQDISIDAGLARTLGAKSPKGKPIAQLMHAAGNYWKHEPEWHIWLQELPERAQKTVDVVLHEKEYGYWPLGDLLHELSGADDNQGVGLTNLVPYLESWRQAVWANTDNV